jgi:cell division inhibitor SulA
MAQRVGSYDTIAGWLHELVARKRTKKSKRCGTATIKGWVILRLWVFWVCLEQFSSG